LREGDYELITEYYNPQKGWITNRWFTLSIMPPWYRSWWAKGGLVSILVGFIWILLRVYVSQKLQKERQEVEKRNLLITERNRIIKDLHDDVGATLSSISIYTEAIKNKLRHNEPEKVMELVNKIGENSRETISTLGDIVWNLNPINDSAEKLFNRMESTATLLLSAQNIRLDFRADPQLFEIEFSLEAKQNLYLIYKETINNISKYAEASQVSISFWNVNAMLEMLISDNGKGFDVSQKSEGNGIRNIRLRTEALRGSAKISSSNLGTETHIRLPLSGLVKG
jgi:signal transduction histidine kinase